jgi:hypothetical protein
MPRRHEDTKCILCFGGNLQVRLPGWAMRKGTLSKELLGEVG